ncbi:Flp family type IVb pilin [Candidatus Nucleicultrix amoebiphila]|uniref:Flp family type IVb pilin n=1 Tax=Candidatus Nucleicultrix amoebiphila TaxID=1509244 RepID=UPI001E3AD227|nr:Flp family type IVb pilin [Candidatus Nucleicultrix amoebiphila]
MGLFNLFKTFFYHEKGATAIEYGLIVGLISVVILATLTSVGTKILAIFNTIINAITTALG